PLGYPLPHAVRPLDERALDPDALRAAAVDLDTRPRAPLGPAPRILQQRPHSLTGRGRRLFGFDRLHGPVPGNPRSRLWEDRTVTTAASLDELEAAVGATASSIDGRRFAFQCPVQGLELQPGGYAVFGGRLGQVQELELACWTPASKPRRGARRSWRRTS